MTLLKKAEKLVHDDLFAITSSLFERRQRAASKWTGPWWSCCDDGSVQAHRVPRSVQVTAVLPSIWTQRSINWKKNGSYVLSLWRRISKNVWSFTHSYVVPNLYDFLLQSIKTQKTILETRLYWWTLTSTVLWEKNTAICIRIFNFMFHRRWKVMHIWNDTWVSKWLQNWYFGVIKPLFLLNTLCIT